MSARATRAALACTAVFAGGACGRSSGPPPGYALQARLGVYQDGSGRAGLAMLATLRDGTGAGPPVPWSAAISESGSTLAIAEYANGGAGSYAAWWWPEVALRDVGYTLTLSGGAESLSAAMDGSTAGGLALPEPVLSGDASRIDWPAVPGAASYECRVYEAGALALDVVVAAPGCDLSALPPGGYEASILAFSADLSQIAASSSRTPPLPARFDVAESGVAFVRPEVGGTTLELLAAGGAFDSGTSERGLAVWVSIRELGGGATSQPWTVSIVGPGISASAPATFEYLANLPRQMAWSDTLPATPGSYALAATSGSTGLSVAFTVGSPPWLPFVVDAAATPGTNGSATVAWTPVDGALAYLVEARRHADQVLVQSMWVAGPPAQFPPYTFTQGCTYDAYVAATDADMSGGAVPAQVSVSEYPYIHASFTE